MWYSNLSPTMGKAEFTDENPRTLFLSAQGFEAAQVSRIRTSQDQSLEENTASCSAPLLHGLDSHGWVSLPGTVHSSGAQYSQGPTNGAPS